MTDAYYEIVEWEKYQHYKHRKPPWIKLYNDMLTSRTWIMAKDADRALMIASMLLASRLQNKIPADMGYIKRVTYLNSTPDFAYLLSVGFVRLIDNASKLQARC